MSRTTRIVLLVLAVLVLVVGVLIAGLASSGDVESGDVQTSTAVPEETPGETSTGAAEPAAPPEPRVETIRISGGKPVGGEKQLVYKRGDTIALRFVSDEPGEVHIHGYDKELEVGGGPKTVRFEANLEGIFEIEDHETETLLANLEVRPK